MSEASAAGAALDASTVIVSPEAAASPEVQFAEAAVNHAQRLLDLAEVQVDKIPAAQAAAAARAEIDAAKIEDTIAQRDAAQAELDSARVALTEAITAWEATQ